MEFPSLGEHCANPSCKKLDFLPMKCDACNEIYCISHFKYDAHSCPQAFMKNNQVPICPLCNQPVPLSKGDLPDVRVNQHIENDCQDNRALKNRIYKNKCSLPRCKQKEMIPITCDQCRKNYCLRHRHPLDHECSGRTVADKRTGGKALSRAAEAALKRANQAAPARPLASQLSRGKIESVQGSLSEDEALAMALQQSTYETEASSSSTGPRNGIVSQGLQRTSRDLLRAGSDKCCLT